MPEPTSERTAPDVATRDRWHRIRSDEHLALCRVEMQARDAIDIARAVGLHLGPLSAALDELTAVRAR